VENPAAADTAGIPVQKFRFWYVAAGSSLASGAGAYLTLAFVPSWWEGVVAGRGWIAVALVIFAGYRPINAVLAALLFAAYLARFVGQARNCRSRHCPVDAALSRHHRADHRTGAGVASGTQADGGAGRTRQPYYRDGPLMTTLLVKEHRLSRHLRRRQARIEECRALCPDNVIEAVGTTAD